MCMNALTSFTKALWSAGIPPRRCFPTSRMCLPKQRDHLQRRQCEDPLPQACLHGGCAQLGHRRPQMPDKTARAFTNSGIKFQLKTHPDRNSLNLNDCVFKTSTSFSALMGRRQRIIEIYTNHGEVTFHENDPRPYTRCVPTTQEMVLRSCRSFPNWPRSGSTFLRPLAYT